MYKNKKVALTGNWFFLPYKDKTDRYTLKHIREIIKSSVGEQIRLSNKVNKKTDILISGLSPDESVIEAAKSFGTEIMSAEQFFGFQKFSSCRSIKEFYNQIRDLGFFVSTTTNEGYEAPTVVSIPIDTYKTGPTELNYKPFWSFERTDCPITRLEINAENAILVYMNEHYEKYFKKSFNAKDSRHRRWAKDLSEFYTPQKKKDPNYWIGSYIFEGTQYMGNVTIENQDHFISKILLEKKMWDLSAEYDQYRSEILFTMEFSDGDHSESIQHLMTFGGIEKDKKTVTFLIFEVIHT